MKNVWELMKKNPIVSLLAVTAVAGVAGMVFACLNAVVQGESAFALADDLVSGFILGALVGAFLLYPAVLTLVQLLGCIWASKTEESRRRAKNYELVTIVLGVLYTMLYFMISAIELDARWYEQLYNSQVHQPIWSEAAPTVIVLCLVGVLGYLILSYVPLRKLPPLVTVLAISAMYLGIMECVLWSIQTFDWGRWLLSVFPLNCVLIGFKTIRYKIYEWNQLQKEREDCGEEKAVAALEKLLQKAELWPVLALVLMWPLLGILLGILILFGQRPDAIVKAWTETADWRLSQQIAPQNAMYDEHYLCTVAAGGHAEIVKPLRMGQRHGHRVVVNRQLCIANAFEQILEERTPGFHRAVRHFYDTYGFPVSRLIRTKGAADVVYLLMKPLEWVFLCVIYLCDVKPENRIAVQYLPFTKEKK